MKKKTFPFFILTLVVMLMAVPYACSRQKHENEVQKFSDGTLKFEVPLKNGKRDGYGYDYYKTGKLKSKVSWKQGKKHGLAEFYYPEGGLKQKSEYDMDRCVISMDYTPEGFLLEKRIYDSLGNNFDYFRYKKDGTRDFSLGTKDPVFIPDQDTLVVGEVLTAFVRLGNRQFSHIDVIIGDVNDSKIILKNKPLPKLDSLTSILTIKATIPGRDSVSGVVFERNETWDSMEVTPFTYRFYVEPN